MIIYKCDGCGKEQTDGSDIKVITLMSTGIDYEHFGQPKLCCMDCLQRASISITLGEENE